MTLAFDDELIDANPCRKVRPLPMDDRRTRYLSADEEKALLTALAGQEWLRAVVVAALHTGMRRGELFNLRWFDVDIGRGMIHVRHTKNGRDRTVPINRTVREVLEHQAKASAYVFPSPKTGARLVDIKRSFKQACTAAALVDFRFHDLRHTAATRLADAGVSVVVIAEVLGHSDIRMTKRYAHAMDEAKREAVERLHHSGVGCQNHAKFQRKEEQPAARLAVSR
ncbi:MAG TPA: site-specific integrase [Pyrinomonadaceae bacterium]